MNRQAADRVSALIVALWALVLLPGLRGGVHVMNANDLLTPVSNMVGLAIVVLIVAAAGYGVAIIIGLLRGREQSRLIALAVGGVSTFVGIFLAATGLVPELAKDSTGAAVVGLTCVGGPLLVVLTLLGGVSFPSFGSRRAPTQPRLYRLLAPTPAPAQPTPDVARPPLTGADATHDYWVSGVAGASTPAPPEPFWEDMSALGWVGFAVLAGAVVLGALWIGTRWHHGDHPLAGLALVALAVGVARAWDARRRRMSR